MLENVLPDWEEKVEKRVKEEIAKNLIKLGLAIEKIIQATGLSEQDILALKTKNANV